MFATETAWQVGQNECALMSLLPGVAMGIPKTRLGPVLGSVNILSVDNEAVYDAWSRNQGLSVGMGSRPRRPAERGGNAVIDATNA